MIKWWYEWMKNEWKMTMWIFDEKLNGLSGCSASNLVKSLFYNAKKWC